VWHASVGFHGVPHRVPTDELRDRTFRALRGVGDSAAGEWVEQHGVYFHLRRRLSVTEATGMVLRDIRGTVEADERLAPLRGLLPDGWAE
jgi:hypothetical protein